MSLLFSTRKDTTKGQVGIYNLNGLIDISTAVKTSRIVTAFAYTWLK